MSKIKDILEEIHQASPPSRNIEFLILLADQLRIGYKPDKNNHKLEELIDLLFHNEDIRNSFQQYIRNVTSKESKIKLLTELGIMSNEGFFTELKIKLAHYLIPPLENKYDMFFLLGKIFRKEDDYRWVSAISNDQWCKLFKLAGFREINQLPGDNRNVAEVVQAARIASLRIAAIGLEAKLIDKLPELRKLKSPFLAQNQELDHLFYNYKKDHPHYNEADYKHLLVILNQCEDYAEKINKNKSKFGISLSLTNLMLRLKQNLGRLRQLLDLLKANPQYADLEREVMFFKYLVRLENQKNHLKQFMSSNLRLLFFQITEHTSNSAEHYISQTWKEYSRLLLAALSGGLIVAFFALFKAEISQFDLAYFGQEVMYSLNYAIAFILIYVTHSTLATKHPAMTASYLARSLDKDKNNSLENLAQLIIDVLRSQFIAFAGNVIMSFAIAFLLIKLFNYYSPEDFISTKEAKKLVKGLSPTNSLALFYAALTGVWLFISGLISGYVNNYVHYHNLRRRLIRHPVLKKFFNPRLLIKFADYLNYNFGSIAGNFSLGVFLGSMAPIGYFLGIPLDVRHITFASGNFGMAYATLPNIDLNIIIHSAIGISLIGFLNFFVSFGLALTIAIKSRRINFKQTRKIGDILLKRLFTRPLDFFFPLANRSK